VVGYFVATSPREILASLRRLPVSGTQTLTFSIPVVPQGTLNDAQDPPQHPVDVSFHRSELQSLVLQSDQNITIDFKNTGDVDLNPPFRVNSGEKIEWRKTGQTTLPTEGNEVRQLFVRNYGREAANFTVKLVTAPEHPQVTTIVMTAGCVVAVFLLYLLQRAAMPRLSAVALSTYKSEVAQPLFLIVMGIGLFAVLAFIWIPYNTLGEDIKVLKDTGMTLIMVLSIFQAIWAASTSVADEIEGRTALTVLSKPIGRGSFIGGKYLGIFWTVAVIFIVLGTAFMLSVSYKPIYDNREGSYKPIYEEQATNTGADEITWQQCHYEMAGVVPGLVLAYLETVVLAALSVAISTRLPMLANFIICFSIYVLGHLTPLIVQSSVGKFAPVRFVAELLSTVLPILDHFNIQAAVSTGATVPYDYLGWTLLYSLLYGVMALLLALVLFEDRDLA
jgi:ABC-type transport system involved in multi-copper enzyme maturation permease subunit